MQLTSVGHGALIALLNIGMDRTAGALSQLTGHDVQLEILDVTIHPISETAEALERIIDADVASVRQIFSGPFSGEGLLLLDRGGAEMLKELLTDEPALPLSIDASAREVLTEVGNILLNACLGTCRDLLKMPGSFSAPYFSLESAETVLEKLRVNHHGLEWALVVRTGFHLCESEVHGYLVIGLSLASLDQLIRAVEESERSGR